MILRKSGFTKKKKVNQSICAQGKKNMETFLKWKGYHNLINNWIDKTSALQFYLPSSSYLSLTSYLYQQNCDSISLIE